MARYEDPPFPLGTTYFGGDTDLIDANVGIELEGLEWDHQDLDATHAQGVQADITHTIRRMWVVRNVSGGDLLAKRVVQLNQSATTAAAYLGQVDDYLEDNSGKGYPVDEAVGIVKDDDLFWVCVHGRAKVTTASSGDTNISLGSFVTADTDGKVVDQDTSQQDANAYPEIQNVVGRCIQAVNATDTDFDIWVDG